MTLEQQISELAKGAVKALYGVEAEEGQIQLQKTRPEFEGNITMVVFPFVKIARKAPQLVGDEIGQWLMANGQGLIAKYNAVQGFLNLVIDDGFWMKQLEAIDAIEDYGQQPSRNKLMMIEYSSPNTNKPLHLGHVRNNLLGYSIAQIQKANGWQIVKTNIVNDRGIHICKSMLAWLKYGNGETPESSGKKGDHLVGDYYVRFDVENKKDPTLIEEAQEMLRKWEANDPEVRALWAQMNEWVYAGFDETYRMLGVDFDKIYYESQTYLEGKSEVEKGLAAGQFYRGEDGSVWADLTSDGLDEKLLLRSDGTSVYMTQDIGTAKIRFQDYPIDKMVYVVGNEQEYHFQVLSILLDRLGFPFGKELVHFSYGMVELPNGKMKSREGTVVDADDLMAKMIEDAGEMNKDPEVARMVGLGALKYFILKVDPRKNMLFNPAESIDFNGNTGPFIQYTYARIRSVMRKAEELGELRDMGLLGKLEEKELALIQRLCEYPATVRTAGDEFSPAVICNYAYALACDFNSFYHDLSILNEPDVTKRSLRLLLSKNVAKVLKSAMNLLGIEMPERM